MAGGHPEFAAGDTAYLVLRSGPEGHAVPVSLSYGSMPVAMTGDVVARGTVGTVSPDSISLIYGSAEFYVPQKKRSGSTIFRSRASGIAAAAGADGQLAIERLLVNGEAGL